MRPDRTIGPTGCRRNSNELTTPKLPPPPRSAPEQVRILRCTRLHELTFGCHHVGRRQVVCGKPELAAEPSKSAAESESCHAGCRVDAERRGKSEGLCLFVKFAKRGARLYPSCPASRIDPDRTHRTSFVPFASRVNMACCLPCAAAATSPPPEPGKGGLVTFGVGHPEFHFQAQSPRPAARPAGSPSWHLLQRYGGEGCGKRPLTFFRTESADTRPLHATVWQTGERRIVS